MATYGTVARSIIQNVLANDGDKMQSIEARFTSVRETKSFKLSATLEAAWIISKMQCYKIDINELSSREKK